ncbi:MAG: alpha-hydroxy acid oxidase [Burkholderiaceae bacterium]
MDDTSRGSPPALKERFQTLQEFIAPARAHVDDGGWDYLVGGTETETSVHRNRLAIESLALRPRVLANVSEVSCGGRLFEQPVALPVMLAPVGGLETFDPRGAVAAAEGAGRFGVPVMLSSVSQCDIADVRAATTGPMIYQLYVRGGGRFIEEHVERALELGLEAFCITVDSAVYSRRERDIVRRFHKPWRAGSQGDARHFQAALSWADVERVLKNYQIPLILKGIATAEDARIAADMGVHAVYVSNHGGRQLDQCLGSLAVLPEVVSVIEGRCRVFVDGGFARGTDIAKALALGADMVGIGRLYCYALAAAGADGVVRMLELLSEEFAIALALLGVTSREGLNAHHVCAAPPPAQRLNALSAFPLLDEVASKIGPRAG